ncbi:hypothetical protein PIB30_038466 [Stylosanthes scabra]|uniref:Uncharacterized protein n=1 Tax=Stylosanthes scabra TaxID=79078 RepID=A0ABU6ZBI0_9FABA|nr:hypothetical protein [Stylosanthes scabra]
MLCTVKGFPKSPDSSTLPSSWVIMRRFFTIISCLKGYTHQHFFPHIVHERIVRLDGDERRVFQERILGLSWGFMYEDLIRINVSMVREFCANFSSAKQDTVFLRGKRMPFTEDDIRRYLNIPGETPDTDQDDNFVALVKAYERGDDMNIAEIYSVISREETNWANDPANNTIPKSINNGILNP